MVRLPSEMYDAPGTASDFRPESTIPANLDGTTGIYIDKEGYNLVSEVFNSESGRFPNIRDHFQLRPFKPIELSQWLEEKDINLTKEGNWYLSDIIETGEAACATMATIGGVWAEQNINETDAYLVNGAKITDLEESEDVGIFESHAFLILDNEEKATELYDPSHYDGLVSDIVDLEEMPEDNRAEDYKIHLEEEAREEILEDYGFRYILKFPEY